MRTKRSRGVRSSHVKVVQIRLGRQLRIAKPPAALTLRAVRWDKLVVGSCCRSRDLLHRVEKWVGERYLAWGRGVREKEEEGERERKKEREREIDQLILAYAISETEMETVYSHVRPSWDGIHRARARSHIYSDEQKHCVLVRE